MRVLLGTIKRLDIALQHGRSAVDFALESIDSSSTVQAFKRVVGETAERAFAVSVFRAPISLLIQNYSADILDDEPTEAEREAGLRANFEQRVLELRELGVDELNHRMDQELVKILSQISAWGEEIYLIMGDQLKFEGEVPEFTSREYWLRVGDVLEGYGMEWPSKSVAPIPFELATLSSALVHETGKSDLMPYAGRQLWVGYVYGFFEEHKGEIIASLSEERAES